MAVDPRAIHVVFQERWTPPRSRGLLDLDPRIRTLLKIIVSYPEVRHVLPSQVSLDPGTEPTVLQTLGGFIRRQAWLVRRVDVN